jgi:hypothetical protein
MASEVTTRIRAACASAQHAFWTAVATEFPEVVTEDFLPMDSFRFQSAALDAVAAWLRTNSPDDERDPPTAGMG